MPHLALSDSGTSPHERLIGHNPQILERWIALEDAFFTSSTFSSELREQVRRELAFGNRCEYCMAKAGPPDVLQQSPRDSLALAFASIVGRDHRDITAAHIGVLREEFSVPEVAELVAFTCFVSAAQMLGAMLGLGAGDLLSHEGQCRKP